MLSTLSKLKKNKFALAIIGGFIFYYEYYRFFCYFQSKAAKYLKEYENIIIDICNKIKYPYKAVVGAIIMTESSGNPTISGSSGEIGLMQIYEPTFNMLNNIYHFNFGFRDLYVPELNIFVGVTLLKYLKNRGLSIKDSIRAYNVGEDLEPKNKANQYLNKVLNWI